VDREGDEGGRQDDGLGFVEGRPRRELDREGLEDGEVANEGKAVGNDHPIGDAEGFKSEAGAEDERRIPSEEGG